MWVADIRGHHLYMKSRVQCGHDVVLSKQIEEVSLDEQAVARGSGSPPIQDLLHLGPISLVKIRLLLRQGAHFG